MDEMDWNKLLSVRRLGQDDRQVVQPDSFGGRSAFDADVGRIMFSGAFRRLSRKTQVHPLATNDYVHTRLTHSMEVAYVGRVLGKTLGRRIQDRLPQAITPDDLGAVVEAACLVHDLGNPPFGHAGEKAMSHWFKAHRLELLSDLSEGYQRDLIAFDGNAQGFRMMTQTENYLFSGGMRLTYATLGTFMKYPWSTQTSEEKFGVFLSEASIFDHVAEALGLIRKGDCSWARHPLAYLVEAADDICYAILDLEDAVELRILAFDQVAETLLALFDEQEVVKIKRNFEGKEAFRVNLARLRGPVFDKVVSGVMDGFIGAYDDIMCGCLTGDIYGQLEVTDPRRTVITSAKKLAREHVFPDPNKVELELGAYPTFEILLEAFCSAAVDYAGYLNDAKSEMVLRGKSELVLKLLGDYVFNEHLPSTIRWGKYQCLRRAIDYVSGMTDNYAVYVAKQLRAMEFTGA